MYFQTVNTASRQYTDRIVVVTRTVFEQACKRWKIQFPGKTKTKKQIGKRKLIKILYFFSYVFPQEFNPACVSKVIWNIDWQVFGVLAMRKKNNVSFSSRNPRERGESVSAVTTMYAHIRIAVSGCCSNRIHRHLCGTHPPPPIASLSERLVWKSCLISGKWVLFARNRQQQLSGVI